MRSLIVQIFIGLLLVVGVFLLIPAIVGFMPAEPSPSPMPTPGSTTVVITLPPSPSPDPTVEPSPTFALSPSPSPFRQLDAPASRVVFPLLDIDLAVVPGSLRVRGNRGGYPLCDVAQYLEHEYFTQPALPGTIYIYAHAQEGMMLPMLEASWRDDGAEMLGQEVIVYTTDGWRYRYEVFEVRRHAIDLSLARDVPPGEHRVILQTSEGPEGTVPKLQVAARLISFESASRSIANPSPEPRPCLPS